MPTGVKRIIIEDLFDITRASFNLNFVKGVLIILSTIAAYLVGTDNFELLIALLSLIGIDLITALFRELILSRAIKSSKMTKTASKIFAYVGIIATANIAGNSLNLPSIEKLLIVYYIAVEAYSIIENADAIGIPIPEVFKKAIRGKIDEQNKS